MVSSELPELCCSPTGSWSSGGPRTGMLTRAEASEEAIMHLATPRGTRAMAS